VDVPIYFTIQPGGAQLWSGKGKWALAQLIYPNLQHYPPGSTASFWEYDPDEGGWFVYGPGKVSADGKSVVPDPGVGFYEFTGAMEQNFVSKPPNSGCQTGARGSGAGEPVDCSTGIFIEGKTDLYLADVIPISLTRVYESQDPNPWSFGIGTSDNYEMYLTNAQNGPLYQSITWILADGQQVRYNNITVPNDNFYTSHFVPAVTSDRSYYGSIITGNGNCAFDSLGCWNLRTKDGTTYIFPEEAHLTSVRQAGVRAIIDRYGSTVTINCDANGNKTLITSPNGRWIQFTNDTTNNRITQATDDLGRTVSYTYNSYSGTGRPTFSSTNMLCAVTDANGGITSYSYDGGNRLLTLSDQLTHTAISNTYD
jgi:hypothetical protein